MENAMRILSAMNLNRTENSYTHLEAVKTKAEGSGGAI